jgi:aminopeptidase N
VGHPIVDISYAYNDAAGKVAVTIKQNQTTHLFQFPIAVDVYSDGSKNRQTVWVKDSSNTFVFPYTGHPNLVNVDADKMMLWVKHDVKSADNYMFQYRKAGNYIDRREALDSLAAMYDSSAAQKEFWYDAMSDPFETLRQKALLFWKKHITDMDNGTEDKVFATAQTFYDNPTRAIAIDVLSKKGAAKYEPVFLKSVNDSSYRVAGAALEALANIDLPKAIALQPQLKKDAGGRLATSLLIVDYLQKTDADADSVMAQYKRMGFMEKAMNQKAIFYYLTKLQNVDKFKKLIGPIIESYTMPGRDFGTPRATILENINWLLDKKQAALATDPNNNNLQEQMKYIQEKMKG